MKNSYYNEGSIERSPASEDNIDIHTQAKVARDLAKKVSSAKSKSAAQGAKSGNTAKTAAVQSQTAAKKDVNISSLTPGKTVITPASVATTGIFRPPKELEVFQSIRMDGTQKPLTEISGITFYTPNSKDSKAEIANISTTTAGDNTVIKIGDGDKAVSITMPTNLIAENKNNGAAIIYDQSSDKYAFCNIQGGKVELPYQSAKRGNAFSELGTTDGEKVFISSCNDTSFDANDMAGVTSSGKYTWEHADLPVDSGLVSSTGSSEAFAVFDSNVNINISGGQDKLYVQNSKVGLSQALGSSKNKPFVSGTNEVNEQDNVLIATDSNSQITVANKFSNDANVSRRVSQIYQTGFDASTFVPSWFSNSAKPSASKSKVAAVPSTAANDGSSSVVETSTFSPDSRFPEFSELNMKNNAAFRSVAGLTFFAPNEKNPDILKNIINVSNNGKETFIKLMNNGKSKYFNDGEASREVDDYTTLVIPNNLIEENKKNGAAVIFDPKTQAYAYCNLSGVKIVGPYQDIYKNSPDALTFAYDGNNRIQLEGEKVYLRNCSNVTYDANDLVSLNANNHYDGDFYTNTTRNLIGSGSSEKIVAIGCTDLHLIAGGDGDKIQIENSSNVSVSSAKSATEESLLYSRGLLNQKKYKENSKVLINADENSSLSLKVSEHLQNINR